MLNSTGRLACFALTVMTHGPPGHPWAHGGVYSKELSIALCVGFLTVVLLGSRREKHQTMSCRKAVQINHSD